MGMKARVRWNLVWFRTLVCLMPLALVLAGCSQATETPSGEPALTPSDESIASLAGLPALTLNVDLTDEGFQPSIVSIPAGRRVKLILRNRGTTEHHYRVVGLVPVDPLWRATSEDMPLEEGVTEEDHDAHHNTDYVPFRAKSPAGIKPLGDEVHAYAVNGGVDVMFFTATSKGTFSVYCPLHPEMAGQVIVF